MKSTGARGSVWSTVAVIVGIVAAGTVVAGLLHVFVHHRPPSASNNQKGDPMTATTIQDAVDGKAL